MDVEVPGVKAGVFLRTERLTLYAVALNLSNDAAIGELIGMTERTVGRARVGIVGERFIAATLRGFGEHEATLTRFGLPVRFEDFFEVRDKTSAGAA